jgi:hypothetical protein
MPTVVLARTSGAYIQQAASTTRSGSNPATFPLTGGASSKAIYALLKFTNIPAEVFGPDSTITAATLSVVTVGHPSEAHEYAARRITETWLSGRVTWATRPAVHSLTGVSTSEARVKGTRIFMDVLAHVQAMHAAGVNFGFEVRFNDTTSHKHSLRNGSAEGDVATLTIEYSTSPLKPTGLSPADGQVVSEANPTLRITSGQASGQVVNAIQVQVDAAHDDVTPDFDTGTVLGSDMQIDLDDYTFTDLTDGQTTAWRARVRGNGNVWSEWSEWADFTYQQFGTLTLLEPQVAPDNKITDPTPPISWDFSEPQEAYRLIFTDPALPPGLDVIYDSGMVTSSDETATPISPVATETGHTYRVTVRTWDAYPRVATGGVADYQEVSRDFTYELTAGVDPVTAFALENMTPYPFVKLTWTRAEPPDGFEIVRDGVSIGVFTAVDLLVSGDDYEYIDTTAAPRREHTWIVRAIVNGEVSATNTALTLEIEPVGIWLSQPEKERYLPFITLASQAMGLTEDGESVNVLGASHGTRIFGGQRGWSGTIVGEIMATPLTDTDTGAELRDQFLLMRQEQGETMILSLLDMALRIVPFNMTIAPTPTLGRNGDYVYAASFEFIEVE